MRLAFRPISYVMAASLAVVMISPAARGADLSDKIFDKAQEKMDQRLDQGTPSGPSAPGVPSATATPGGRAASKIADGTPRLTAETAATVLVRYAPEVLSDAAIEQWIAEFPGQFGLSEEEAEALLAGTGPSRNRLEALRQTLKDEEGNAPARLADVGEAPVKQYSFKKEAFQLSRAIAYGGEVKAPYQPAGATVIFRVRPEIRLTELPMPPYEAEVIRSALPSEEPVFVTEAVLSIEDATVSERNGRTRVVVDLSLDEVALFTGTKEGETGPVPEGRIRALDLEKWRVDAE